MKQASSNSERSIRIAAILAAIMGLILLFGWIHARLRRRTMDRLEERYRIEDLRASDAQQERQRQREREVSGLVNDPNTVTTTQGIVLGLRILPADDSPTTRLEFSYEKPLGVTYVLSGLKHATVYANGEAVRVLRGRTEDPVVLSPRAGKYVQHIALDRLYPESTLFKVAWSCTDIRTGIETSIEIVAAP